MAHLRISEEICREIQNTHPPPVYETVWEYIVQLGSPQMTIRHMRFACWILNPLTPDDDYSCRTVPHR